MRIIHLLAGATVSFFLAAGAPNSNFAAYEECLKAIDFGTNEYGINPNRNGNGLIFIPFGANRGSNLGYLLQNGKLYQYSHSKAAGTFTLLDGVGNTLTDVRRTNKSGKTDIREVLGYHASLHNLESSTWEKLKFFADNIPYRFDRKAWKSFKPIWDERGAFIRDTKDLLSTAESDWWNTTFIYPTPVSDQQTRLFLQDQLNELIPTLNKLQARRGEAAIRAILHQCRNLDDESLLVLVRQQEALLSKEDRPRDRPEGPTEPAAPTQH